MIYSPSYSKDSELREELLRIAAVLAVLVEGHMLVAYAPPKRTRDGMTLICDGILWNPLGDGVKRPIWYDAGAGTWKSFT